MSVEEIGCTKFVTVATLATETVISFHILASNLKYVDLSNSLLYVRAQIVNADRSNSTNDIEVAPVNYFSHAHWHRVYLVLN